MTGYVKLFQSILGSSIWAAPDWELRVWIALLVLKDRNHTVKMSVPGLANIARVTLDQCREALMKFREPDDDSSDKQFDGRKIQNLDDGGWLILNGERYAKMLSYDERREYNRQKQAEYRRRKKDLRHRAQCEGAQVAIKEGLDEASKSARGDLQS